MHSKVDILLIGDADVVAPFIPLLTREGVQFEVLENVEDALEKTKQFEPNLVLFVTPRYWDDVTRYVVELRKHSSLRRTSIIYIGSLIEGEDHRVLHEMGVETLTLGPVPHEEMVRYVVKNLHRV